MVAIKKRGRSSLEAIPKPIKLSLKPIKRSINILPPPPPPGIKPKKSKINIPKPIQNKKSFDIPLPLHEAGHEELPPPPPYIPFDLIHPKKDRLLEKELRFKEKKKQRVVEKERRLKEQEEKKQLKLEKKRIEEKTPKQKGFLEGLFSKKEESFIEKERKKLEKLKEKELEKKEKIGKIRLEQEKELEKKAKEFEMPELEELPELEGLPELEELPPIEEEFEKKKEAKLPSLDLFSIKKLLPKKKPEKIEPEIEEPLEAEELEIPELEEFPETEELPQIDELPPVEEMKEKKKITLPKIDLNKLLQKKRIPKPEAEMEEPPTPEDVAEELEIPELEEKKQEQAKREITEAIEKLKTAKPVEYEFEKESKEDIVYTADQMIKDARDALLNLNIRKAKEIYIGIMKIYNSLDDYKKNKVYEAIRELYDERKAAEAMLNK